jgi:SAM-dependent methyltransferase
MRERFADDDRIVVAEGTDASLEPSSCDTIVLSNVLEHIPDDSAALRSIRAALRPGGRVIVYSPAFDSLYSNFDAMVGHYRRYRLSGLRRRLRAAGFDVVESRYVNSLGAAAWLLYARLLGQVPTNPAASGLYDKVAVPMVRRLEAGRRVPFGQSILAVGERPTG